MVRKHSLYTAAMFGWALLVFGATVAVFSGQAEPLVSPSQLPVNGPLALFGVAAGLVVLGAVAVGGLKKGSWRRTGRRANLTPEGGGLFGKPDLVGTVDGRPVRARTISRRTSGGGESGSSKTTYTVVEADLREPAEEGLVIGRTDGDGGPVPGKVNVSPESETVGDFEVVGGSEDLAREVLASRTRDALREPALLESVLVGNAAGVLLEAVPDSDGFLAGRLTDGIEHKIETEIPGDAATVRTETKGLLLDSEELERQVRAVVAVADEFERATAR